MSILVAIPSYERPELLGYCINTACELKSDEPYEIVIFDDASPTLDLEAFVRKGRLSVSRSETNVGPSGTISRIWRHFLTSRHEYLFFLDDDLIANTDALAVGMARLASQSGLLSLYNSTMHTGVSVAPDLLEKQRLGNAGTFWTRDLVALALRELEGQDHIDNRYSGLFAARGIPMLATVQSRVQHLGIKGRHNWRFGQLEHGLGFEPDSESQMRALCRTYDVLMTHQADYMRPPFKTRMAIAFGLRRIERAKKTPSPS
ncbi:Glycosyl transferase family 2 [Devosia enhydra]|uniref:Glycosyl transferase family 2 n=1 Tax=Devosia enhydra TaxID=665118 RepID=A0A1K2HX69_9HYPH|nr:glycosyltransferase [Devosia enhydra]SFZ82816.1 Glycosyl transferase family 2 [Devosia enhydra]